MALEMARGSDLGDALRTLAKTMDGFYTLLVSTKDQFAVVRDPFACKPAVVAETPDYVAMSSEYRALAGLPDIEKAEVFEPMPEEIHTWTRSTATADHPPDQRAIALPARWEQGLRKPAPR